MKSKVLALLIPALLAAGAAHAAEVYNKDGNKLDLYGKVDGLHYFSDNSAKDGDQSYARLGFKGETQINDQLTGYGQWEYNIQATKAAAAVRKITIEANQTADFEDNDFSGKRSLMESVEAKTKDIMPVAFEFKCVPW